MHWLSELDAAVESVNDGVGVVDGDLLDISQCLELGSALLELRICHVDVELSGTRLDGVPTSQTGGEVDISAQTEIGRLRVYKHGLKRCKKLNITYVDNLIGLWVGQNSLGVNTSLVGESLRS